MKDSPPGSIGACSPNGWIDSSLFVKWLTYFIAFVIPTKDKKILLILDGHSSKSWSNWDATPEWNCHAVSPTTHNPSHETTWHNILLSTEGELQQRVWQIDSDKCRIFYSLQCACAKSSINTSSECEVSVHMKFSIHIQLSTSTHFARTVWCRLSIDRRCIHWLPTKHSRFLMFTRTLKIYVSKNKMFAIDETKQCAFIKCTHTCTRAYMNVVVKCNLCQTVLPAVSIRKIEKMKQQSQSHSVT